MTNQPTELEVTDVSYWADQLDALEKLEKNPEFKKIIMDGYLKDKVLDSVSLLTVPSIKDNNKRSDVMEDLVAASGLMYHLHMIRQLGEGARADLLEEEFGEE
jgi:hypothetical protein